MDDDDDDECSSLPVAYDHDAFDDDNDDGSGDD